LMRNTEASASVQWPACEQIARLSRMVMRFPRYASRLFFAGSAVFAPLKPIAPCVPSQNGLFLEAPQRHSATPRTVAQASPDARRSPGTGVGTGSSIRKYGPLLPTAIFGLASIQTCYARGHMMPTELAREGTGNSGRQATTVGPCGPLLRAAAPRPRR